MQCKALATQFPIFMLLRTFRFRLVLKTHRRVLFQFRNVFIDRWFEVFIIFTENLNIFSMFLQQIDLLYTTATINNYKHIFRNSTACDFDSCVFAFYFFKMWCKVPKNSDDHIEQSAMNNER